MTLPFPTRSVRARSIAPRRYELVETFIEAGASATNDRRPGFQRMIEAGTSRPAPLEVVVVHRFSRFFRDHFELEFNVRKLARNNRPHDATEAGVANLDENLKERNRWFESDP